MSPEKHEVDDQALEQMRSEMATEIDAYRAALTSREPSTRHRAKMERMLVELVREDVRDDWSRLSVSARARRIWQRWNAAWREMVEASFAFRLASQGAMALGIGLVLAILFVDGGRSATAYDTEMEMPRQEPVPVPAVDDSIGADEFRRSIEVEDRRGLGSRVGRKK